MDIGTLIQVVSMINIMLDEKHHDNKPQTNHDDDYEEDEDYGVDGVSIEDITFWREHGRTSALRDVRKRLQDEIDLQIAEMESAQGE